MTRTRSELASSHRRKNDDEEIDCGGAIGEGAAVVAQIHAFLARESAGVEVRAA